MDRDCLILDDNMKDELQQFGSWYLENCQQNTLIMNALYRYGFCLPQIALCVAKTVLDDTVGDVQLWSRQNGYTPMIITALLKTLGLPSDHETRLNLHVLTASKPFRGHTAFHDQSNLCIVPSPKHMNDGECHENSNMWNQCSMAQTNQRLIRVLQRKLKDREKRILTTRAEFVRQQRKQLEDERKQKHQQWMKSHNVSDIQNNSNIVPLRITLSTTTLILAILALFFVTYFFDKSEC